MMLHKILPPPKIEDFGSSVSSQESVRSSISPENLEDLMEDNVVAKNEDVEISERVKKLENDFVFIKHQLTLIMTHLHVEGCKCTTCVKVKEEKAPKKENEAIEMLSHLFPNASLEQIQSLLDLSKKSKVPSTPKETTVIPEATVIPKPPADEGLKLGQGYENGAGAGKIQTERYSEPTRKVKKFSLPPAVTHFLQRKDSGNALIQPNTPNSNTASPGPSSSDGDDHMDTPLDMQVQSSTVPSTPTAGKGSNLFTQSMMDMLRHNAAHSTGSPGFLRGRGRGRPKLIGDELDADLVDYMVTLKNADPHKGNFTASQALHMARQYILERAPGLLEEHGGHVKLKLTWAMKLVSRIGERQKEIELGLPAGTLSNMGRNLTNLPTGGNFMADIMAQNLFSQQLMMGNLLGGGSPKQNEENIHVKKEKEVTQMPEIVNIKELAFINNFLAELNDNNGEAGPSAALFAPKS
ncbi:hypothetical protein L5515_003368 [Caenorhabditis briggsae]|uniref:Uncharacterized protein n=1 Tax=Caenorhabditis briggsae TaxID=6238 RepID=A0AAE9EEN5_CAEBR|nr:hypothetical protein L5515_003368 [Caenorhabditis briggsae]